jgi:hypothetical protein
VRRCASSVERPAAVARIHSFIHSFIHAFAAVTTFRDIFRDDATTRRTDAAPRYDPNEFVADAFAPTWAAMDFTRRFAASTLMIRMTKFRSREGESADGTGRTRGDDDDDDDDARTRRVRTLRVKYRWCDYLNTSEIDVGSRVDV